MYMIQLKSRAHGGHIIVTLASQVSSGVCLNHTCEHTCTCMHAQAEMYAHTYPHTHTHATHTQDAGFTSVSLGLYKGLLHTRDLINDSH